MKTNHIKSQSVKNKLYELYVDAVNKGERPGIIVRIAENYDVAPCLVAKLILQKYFEEHDLFEADANGNNNINVYLRDTTSIPNVDLSYEIFLVRECCKVKN